LILQLQRVMLGNGLHGTKELRACQTSRAGGQRWRHILGVPLDEYRLGLHNTQNQRPEKKNGKSDAGSDRIDCSRDVIITEISFSFAPAASGKRGRRAGLALDQRAAGTQTSTI
jgi:hypothetical protein